MMIVVIVVVVIVIVIPYPDGSNPTFFLQIGKLLQNFQCDRIIVTIATTTTTTTTIDL